MRDDLLSTPVVSRLQLNDTGCKVKTDVSGFFTVCKQFSQGSLCWQSGFDI